MAEQPYRCSNTFQCLLDQPPCQSLTAVFRRDQQPGQPVSLRDGGEAQAGDDVPVGRHPAACPRHATHLAALSAIELVQQGLQLGRKLANGRGWHGVGKISFERCMLTHRVLRYRGPHAAPAVHADSAIFGNPPGPEAEIVPTKGRTRCWACWLCWPSCSTVWVQGYLPGTRP